MRLSSQGEAFDRAAFQAAVSDTRSISQASLRDVCGHEAGEIAANCVSGLFDGGLKGRLQARLPATQGGRLQPQMAKAERAA